MSTPTRRGVLMQSSGAEGWMVYEPDSDSLHALNDSARAIWELCDGSTSPSEMAAAISELTGVELSMAQRDVDETLSLLRRLGLVTD